MLSNLRLAELEASYSYYAGIWVNSADIRTAIILIRSFKFKHDNK